MNCRQASIMFFEEMRQILTIRYAGLSDQFLMPSSVSNDLVVNLRSMGTDELGIVYVSLLRTPNGPSRERETIQHEWSSRSKAERLAALRLMREQSVAETAALVKLNVSALPADLNRL